MDGLDLLFISGFCIRRGAAPHLVRALRGYGIGYVRIRPNLRHEADEQIESALYPDPRYDR